MMISLFSLYFRKQNWKLYVCVCVCLYVCLHLEEGSINLPKIWHAYFLEQGRNFRMVKTLKSILGLSPSESNFYGSVTKCDRKTGPRPEFFLSVSKLQEQRPKSWKIAMDSRCGEGGLLCSESKHEECRGDDNNNGHKPENCPVFNSWWKCWVLRQYLFCYVQLC